MTAPTTPAERAEWLANPLSSYRDALPRLIADVERLEARDWGQHTKDTIAGYQARAEKAEAERDEARIVLESVKRVDDEMISHQSKLLDDLRARLARAVSALGDAADRLGDRRGLRVEAVLAAERAAGGK